MVTIELQEDDLYANGGIIEFEDGTLSLERGIPEYTPSIGDDFYEPQFQDDFDTLAFAKYQNSKLWHRIADANNIINPFEQLPNTIVLPSINQNSYN